MRTREDRQQLGPRRGILRCPGARSSPMLPPPSNRFYYTNDAVTVVGWPSRGSKILLERASGADFEFLRLDSTNFSLAIMRHPDQDTEDRFCERLLLLGAKWFDSRDRADFILDLQRDEQCAIDKLDDKTVPRPTKMERRWISVGWPTGGGLWVAEYDTSMSGGLPENIVMPRHASRVILARSMQEKCDILKGMGAKYYATLEEYDGPSCLKAWKTKTTGEVEPLEKTEFDIEEVYV